ncbi:MAG: c-type cytochrome [Sphingobacteriales bacterium]|nr:MAG: c-type cytochrome [Sphingobacteriales bacterium]
MRRLLLLIFIGLASCSPDENSYTDIPLELTRPSNFPDPEYNLSRNMPTQAGFELGKKLFYDGRLSRDGTISCGFCHIQQDAFTHHGHSLSHGIDNMVGLRNTPAIQNMAYQRAFMWDGAADHLDLQPIIPLTSELEMDGRFPDIVAMLQGDDDYHSLFARAFPDQPIDSEHLLKALSQFMVMMESTNSKFDKFRRGESGGGLSASESAGYQTFLNKCSGCHATDLQSDQSFRNNGLAFNQVLGDRGRMEVTGLEQDRQKFRVPSLRNVAKTAPYMHDGRFYSLEAVLNHYASGVQDSPNLDSALRTGNTVGISLSQAEKTNIIAFLQTLTDVEFLSDRRFSEY